MKAKKIIITIVIVLAILATLGGVFAFLWFKTSLFNWLKPSDDLFADQLKTAFNLKDFKYTDYSDALNDYKDLSERPVKSKFNISANLKISELDSEVQDVINKSKITIESNADVKNKKSQNKVGLYSSNSEVLTVDMVTDNDKIGIGCKDLYDKYLVVSMDDLIDYLKKSGDIDDDELEMISKMASGNNLNLYDLLYISEDDLKHFDKEYSIEKIIDLISKDCFSKKSNVEVEVDGDNVKTYATYLTVTGADAYKFAEDFSNKLKDDSVVTKLVADKANMVLEYAGEDKLSEKEIKQYMDQLFDNMLDELEGLKDEKDAAIQVAIYSKNNKPVRIDVNVLEDVEDDDKETVFSIEYAKNKDIYTVYNNGKAYITVVDEYEKKSKDEYKGKFTAKAQGMSIGTLDYEIVNKEKESKLYLNLNIPLADVSGKIDISTKGNYKKEAVEVNGVISFNYRKEAAEVKFDGTVEFGDVSIPELNSSNSVNILKLSEKELQEEADKILKKASEVLPARLKLIGVNVKAEDIYKNTVTVPETTTTTPATTLNTSDLEKQLKENQELIDSLQKQLNNY